MSYHRQSRGIIFKDKKETQLIWRKKIFSVQNLEFDFTLAFWYWLFCFRIIPLLTFTKVCLFCCSNKFDSIACTVFLYLQLHIQHFKHTPINKGSTTKKEKNGKKLVVKSRFGLWTHNQVCFLCIGGRQAYCNTLSPYYHPKINYSSFKNILAFLFVCQVHVWSVKVCMKFEMVIMKVEQEG